MRKALSNNAERGITGFLHRSRTHYYQCIEGRDREIDLLVQKIKADPRHYNVQTLLEEQTDFRHFVGWSMGYSQDMAGHKDLRINPKTDPDRIQKFLIDQADLQKKGLEVSVIEAARPSLDGRSQVREATH